MSILNTLKRLYCLFNGHRWGSNKHECLTCGIHWMSMPLTRYDAASIAGIPNDSWIEHLILRNNIELDRRRQIELLYKRTIESIIAVKIYCRTCGFENTAKFDYDAITDIHHAIASGKRLERVRIGQCSNGHSIGVDVS